MPAQRRHSTRGGRRSAHGAHDMSHWRKYVLWRTVLAAVTGSFVSRQFISGTIPGSNGTN